MFSCNLSYNSIDSGTKSLSILNIFISYKSLKLAGGSLASSKQDLILSLAKRSSKSNNSKLGTGKSLIIGSKQPIVMEVKESQIVEE